VKYLPLFHHFKAIYQFPKHIIFLVKIVANAPLNFIILQTQFQKFTGAVVAVLGAVLLLINFQLIFKK